MKQEDRARLSDMLAHGEDNQAIVAFFKVMGYSKEEVLDELVSAEPGEHVDSKPDEPPIQVFELNMGIKRGPERMISLILIICFVVVSANFLMPFFMPAEEEEAPNQWEVVVNRVECRENSASIRVQNAEMPSVPVTQFSILENNATCVPPVALHAVWSQTTITCGGSFETNRTYTLMSNNTVNTWFTCRYP